MIINKIFSAIKTGKAEKNSPFKEMQKQNNELLQQSLEPLSSEALANTAKGSFQAMQNLQELNRQLQAQVQNNSK